MKSKPIAVITGAAGFLGSHLTDRLLSEDWKVIGLDNILTGSADNLAHLLGNSDFSFIRADVSNYIFVPGRVDYVFHLASPASPIDYLTYPIPTLKVGALGTHNALGLAKHKGAKFFLASTSETYGDPLIHPQPETYWGNVNPVGPRGVYDEAKRFAEALVMAYHRYHRIDTKIVRIFNTYGPRMRMNDGRVVPSLLSQALKGEPLTVYGDGSQTRSFCYVSDLIEGCYRLAMSEEHGPMNVGNPNEMSILQFAQRVRDLSRSSSPIEFRPLPQDDPKVRQPDITLARTKLGWDPVVPFSKGIALTIDFFRHRLGPPGLTQAL
jgi:dTDP-glucose 4,6-dehydratase